MIPKQNIPCITAIAALIFLACSSVTVAVTPAKIFSDHMVLQRDACSSHCGAKQMRGSASVTVAFAGQVGDRQVRTRKVAGS